MLGKRRFRIYYRDTEYAREMGDPCLGVVVARTKEEAETLAARKRLGPAWNPVGYWAVPEKGARES